MKFLLSSLVSLLAATALALPAKNVETRAAQGLPRLAIYYQTTHDPSGTVPISMLPLITEKNIALTHLIVCSFHINLNSEIHLNDFPPGDPHFATLWEEAKILKAAGVRITGMVGGAAPGSFSTQTLDGNDATFEHYYGQLRDVIALYGLQGMDLDVEQSMSQAGITRLVNRLSADFGPDFDVTLAPVASALNGGSNLSGFNYKTLETAAGSKIGFYNAQFYNGFGSMATTRSFDAVVANGFAANKVLAGQVTNPSSGSQFVAFATLNATIQALRAKYGEIGGVMGWEYFNSKPGDTARPWEWAQEMTKILRPNSVVNLTITKETALRLEAAWRVSTAASGARMDSVTPSVDYMAMVNA